MLDAMTMDASGPPAAMAAGVDPFASPLYAGALNTIAGITPKRLAAAVEKSYSALAWVRERAVKADEFVAGRHHNPSGDSRTKRPLNLSYQQLRTLMPYLAFQYPAPNITARTPGMEMAAELHQAQLELLSESLNLGDMSIETVTEAILHGVAARKICLAAGDEILKQGDKSIDPGEISEEPVPIEDLVWDCTANRFESRWFDGHRYSMAVDEAVETQLFGLDPAEVDPVSGFRHPHVATRQEAAEIMRALTRRGSGGETERRADEPADRDAYLVDEVRLWDIAVRCRGSVWVFTIAADRVTDKRGTDGAAPQMADKFLAVKEWGVDELGPMRFLWFLKIPGSLTPLSLDAAQRDLAEIADLLMNKTVRQILKTKQNTVYRPGSEDLATTLAEAEPDGFVKGDPSALASVKSGGLLGEMLPGLQTVTGIWNEQTGALNVSAGNGVDTSTGTLGEFQGLMGRAMTFIRFLQMRVGRYESACMRTRLTYLMEDPLIDSVLPYRLPSGATVPVRYPELARRGTKRDFSVACHAYSMEVLEPHLQVQRIMEFFERVYPRFMEYAAMGMDVRPMIRIVGRKMGIEDLDLFTPIAPPSVGMPTTGAPPAPPGRPTRPPIQQPAAI